MIASVRVNVSGRPAAGWVAWAGGGVDSVSGPVSVAGDSVDGDGVVREGVVGVAERGVEAVETALELLLRLSRLSRERAITLPRVRTSASAFGVGVRGRGAGAGECDPVARREARAPFTYSACPGGVALRLHVVLAGEIGGFRLHLAGEAAPGRGHAMMRCGDGGLPLVAQRGGARRIRHGEESSLVNSPGFLRASSYAHIDMFERGAGLGALHER